MNNNLKDYADFFKTDIQKCLDDLSCQPIVFAGSGISRRYFKAPSWEELLAIMAEMCPLIDKPMEYYKQTFETLIDVSSHFSDCFHKWAWAEGKSNFPKELFGSNIPKSAYLKFSVARYLESIVPDLGKAVFRQKEKEELNSLKSIHPHAIITTNYDRFLDQLFDEYTPIIGQRLLRANHASIGEIYKIHGCVSDVSEIVLTREDYHEFSRKKKYLSAKLLTYFLEHPLLILGYGLQDPNVVAILQDIDEILNSNGRLVSNIYFVSYSASIDDSPPTESLFDLGEGKSMRLKTIHSSEFKWIYEAFSSGEEIQNVNPKLLRALMARTYTLVRHDIPKREAQVNFSTLENVVQQEGSLARVLGISSIDAPENLNAHYPYIITSVAEQLGFSSWYHVNVLIKKVQEEKGVDIKASDNQYHLTIKSGKKSSTHKYSQKLVDLLRLVKDGKPYSLRLKK